jgi:putative inorganic carbon (hco3(-)) transporter
MNNRRISETIASSTRALLILVLIGSPFLLGSVGPPGVFFIEAGAATLVLLWIIQQSLEKKVRLALTGTALPLCLLLAYAALTLTPINLPLLAWLSPGAHSITKDAGEILAAAGNAMAPTPRISLGRWETESEILKLASYSVFFYLGICLWRTRSDCRKVADSLIAAGTLAAALGIGQNLWGNGKIYGWFDPGGAAFFGPFANHNHFGGYMELVLGIALGTLAGEIHRLLRTGGEGEVADWPSKVRSATSSRIWILGVACFLMLAAMTASQSRGAVVGFLGASLLFGLLGSIGLLKRKNVGNEGFPGHKAAILAAAFLIIIMVIGALSFSPYGRSRWTSVYETAGRYRIRIWTDTLAAISDYGMTGSGLGTFRLVYPRYKTGLFGSETTHAESEYLEGMLEIGAIGSMLVFALGIAFFRESVLRLAGRKDTAARYLGYGALFSIASLSAHNALDFNLHVPSNALTFILAAALCISIAHLRRGSRGDRFTLPEKTFPLPGAAGLAIIAFAAAIAVILLMGGYRHCRAVLQEDRWIAERPFLLRGDPENSQFQFLADSSKWAPYRDSPHYLEAAAYLAAAETKNFFEYAKRRELLADAGREIAEAIRIQPARSLNWAAFAQVEAAGGRHETAEKAFRQAIRLEKTNGAIHRNYGKFLLLRGRVEEAVAHFNISRNYPNADLGDMLSALMVRTRDRMIWQKVLRNQPEDYRIYAQFLRAQQMEELARQAEQQAALLESVRTKPAAQ